MRALPALQMQWTDLLPQYAGCSHSRVDTRKPDMAESEQTCIILIFEKAATCSHLAATCSSSHLAAPCSHLAATCSSSQLQPLASHLLKQPLGSHLLKQPAATCCCCSHLGQASASGCEWLQVAAWASGCKWLLGQVAATKWLLGQVAASGCNWLHPSAATHSPLPPRAILKKRWFCRFRLFSRLSVVDC